MTKLHRRVATALAATAIVGTLTFGTVGVAGAASGSPTAPTTAQVSKGLAQMEKHFNCSTAERRLGYAQRIEARFTKKLHKLQALETKAQAAKHTTLAAYWQKIIAHEQKVEAKVVGAKLLARQAKVTRLAQNKCHTSLPTATASTASSTTA